MSRSPSTLGSAKHRTVALVGNPNTGKTTLFNVLTGYRQRVGNYPGVTVERRTGLLRGDGIDIPIELIDLPGAYSLAANSADEAVVLHALLGHQDDIKEPDVIVVVVDATKLSRNLFFTTQALEIGRPVVVALNMVDVAEASGMRIDARVLSEELGVPVVPVVATKQTGIGSLRQTILDSLDAPVPEHSTSFPDCVRKEVEGLTNRIARCTGDRNRRASRVEALQTLLDPGGYHEQRLAGRCGESFAKELVERRRRIEAAGESIVEVEARARYGWIEQVVRRAVTRVRPAPRSRSEIVDRLLTHRVAGLLIFLVMMGACFEAVYTWAGPLMDVIDGAFVVLGNLIIELLPAGAVQSLLKDGIVTGVGAVLIFLPQILILFFFISILEDCGYMARAAFLLDRWMGLIGLSGKSFIPLLCSFACAVPGIMATRTIENRQDRFVTMLIAPLMSCSARLPVYVLLIGAFVPAEPLLGGLLGLQAVTLLAFYFVGIGVAIPVTLILKRTILRGAPQSFLMELPTYKRPSPRTVLYRVYEQGKIFCLSAGTIIIAVTVVVWVLGYYPRPARIAVDHDAQRSAAHQAHAEQLHSLAEQYDLARAPNTLMDDHAVAPVLAKIEELEADFLAGMTAAGIDKGTDEWLACRRVHAERVAATVTGAGAAGETALAVHTANRELERRLVEIDRSESGTYLRQSLLGRMGCWIEPIVKPLGWDWRIGTAVIASFPAREVVVATMGTIYNLGNEQDTASGGLRQKLLRATGPDGRPVFNLAVALSIMVFFALCCQCGATLAVVKRETNTWRWPVFMFTYMTLVAYVAALATYQVTIRLIQEST